ncbi:hypothetical protein ACH5RR_003987 [Cinchona calisaya]|uniref:Uncharacterized protein n=1 Tax=Cinchona calisaya TaxID=153742 RepID=A0ABD3AWE6_9GENT
MTRRSHCFKRYTTTNNNNSSRIKENNSSSNSNTSSYEINVQLNSPRSETYTNANSGDGFHSLVEKKQTRLGNLTQRVHLKKKIGSLGVDFGLRLELKGKRKLGHWTFLVFCGVCLFLGIFKFCANGWFGSAIDRVESNQDFYDSVWTPLHVKDQGARDYGYRTGENDEAGRENDVDRTLKTVASGVVGSQNEMVNSWMKRQIVTF